MCDGVARSVRPLRQRGEPPPIADADVDLLSDSYQNACGQR
jgi:L-ribulose-5-phosphate 4-epimerase